jgi:phage-related protein (TIGR01555 family)
MNLLKPSTWFADGAADMAATQVRAVMADGMANFISGLGAANPKTNANAYVVPPVSQQQLEAAYRTSAWFRKIVNTRPRDAVRKWRSWQADKATIELLENEEKRLNYRAKVLQALIWADLYGGAVILALGLPGTNDQPFNVDSVRKGSIQSLVVLTRYEINPTGRITDPFAPGYGGPEKFTINSGGSVQTDIHPSRVFAFRGQKGTSPSSDTELWGDSMWTRMEDAISPVDASAAVVAALMQEAKVDIVRAKNLTQNMAASDAEMRYLKRFTLSNMLKSVANTVLLDADDEWSQKTINWTGIPEAVLLQMTIMAGAADYPLTVLLGTQSKGLGNDGAGDRINYNSSLESWQELDVTPQMMPLDEVLIRSATGKRDPGIWYRWVPLNQLTEKERADIDKLQAEATQIYVNAALIPADALAKAVQNRMIESGSWPGLDEALAGSDGELPEDTEEFDEDGEPIIDAAPLPLYVRRDVLNADDIIAWAKAQGFKTTLPASDMHVTIAYSHEPVDWMAAGENWSGDQKGNLTINAGGPRLMEQFGDARVLLFASSQLSWRHESIKNIGASWDHPEYQPRITISYDAESPDLKAVEPYRGAIVLGPEIFEAIKEDWQSGIKES